MRLELEIDGMLAVHAKRAVFTALAAVEGLRHAEVELGRAVVDVDRAESELGSVEGQLRDALEAVGHTVVTVRRLPKALPTL